MNRPAAAPDPLATLDRRKFGSTWWALQALKGPYANQFADIQRAESRLLASSTGGQAPLAWCGDCGAPFFDGDEFRVDRSGIAACRRSADDRPLGRCFDEGGKP